MWSIYSKWENSEWANSFSGQWHLNNWTRLRSFADKEQRNREIIKLEQCYNGIGWKFSKGEELDVNDIN